VINYHQTCTGGAIIKVIKVKFCDLFIVQTLTTSRTGTNTSVSCLMHVSLESLAARSEESE